MSGANLLDCASSDNSSSAETLQYLRAWIKKHGVCKVADVDDKVTSIDGKSLIYIEGGAWQLIVGEHKTINIICAGGIICLDCVPSERAVKHTQHKIIARTTYYEFPISQIQLSSIDPRFINSIFDFVILSAREISNKWLVQCTNDSYKKIKISLEWINSFPDDVKCKFTLIHFISATTGVSRSHALAIVRSLKLGEYIEIDRGYLVRILKKLPLSY